MHNHNHTAQSRWRQARWPYPSQPMDLREPASRNSSFSSSLLEVPIPTPADSIPPSPSLTAPLRAEILEAAYASSDDDDDESPQQQLHPLTHTHTHTRTGGIPLPPSARTHLPGNRVGSLARDSIPINLARETSRHSHHVPAHTRSPPSAHPHAHAHLFPNILADIPHLDLARLAHRLHDRLPTLALPHLPVVHVHAPPLIQRRMSMGGHHEIDGAWGARVRGWMSMKKDAVAAPPPPQATPTIDLPPPPPLVHVHLWSTDSPLVEGEHVPPSESNAAALLLTAPSSSALISPPRSPPMTASSSPDLSPPQSISLELDPPTPMRTPALYSDRTPPHSILLDPSELEYEYQHETMIRTTKTTMTTAKGKSASNTSSTPTPSTTTTTTTTTTATTNLHSSSSSLPTNAAIRLLSIPSLSLNETPLPLPKAAQEYGILPPTWSAFVADLRTACEDKEREEAAEAAAEDEEEEEEGHLSNLPERIKLGLPRRIVDSHPSLRGHGHPPSSRSRPSPSSPNPHPHPHPTYKNPNPNPNPNRLSILLERYNTHVFTPLGIQALLCREFPRAEGAKPRWAVYVLELASDSQPSDSHTPRAGAGAALATTSSSSLSTEGGSQNADRSISLAQRFGRVPEGLWKIDICDPVVWHLRVSLFPAADAAAPVREEGEGEGERRILEEASGRDVFGVAGSGGSSTLSFGESFF